MGSFASENTEVVLSLLRLTSPHFSHSFSLHRFELLACSRYARDKDAMCTLVPLNLLLQSELADA